MPWDFNQSVIPKNLFPSPPLLYLPPASCALLVQFFSYPMDFSRIKTALGKAISHLVKQGGGVIRKTTGFET